MSALPKHCMECGRESLTDCCIECERRLHPPDTPAQTDYDQTDYDPERGNHSRTSKSVNPFGNDCETDYGTEETSTDYVPEPGLSGDGLRAWDRNDEATERICVLVGLRFVEDEQQHLTIGGVTLLLSPWRTKDGWVLRVWEGWPTRPPKKPRRSISLTELYASAVSGVVQAWGGPWHAVWHRRLLVDIGMVAPAVVEAPDLPTDAPPSAVKTWELALHMLSIRWLEEPGAPFPLVAPRLAEWSGGSVTEATIRVGKKWLANRVIEQVGLAPGSFGKQTVLWQFRETTT